MRFQMTLRESEIEAGCLEGDTRDRALALFREHGALLLHDVFPRDALDHVREAFFADYAAARKSGRGKEIGVGHQRIMVQVEMAPPFDDPVLYANPILLPLLFELLGEGMILNSFGMILAWPGAEAQAVHIDHPPLFESLDLHANLPPYAVTLLVPLLDMNQENGATQMCLGSHRLSADQEPTTAPCVVEASLGACVLMDFRLWHGGTPVTGGNPRPLLYIVYSRPWFRDLNVSIAGSSTETKFQPLSLPGRVFDALPARYQPLFQFANRT